MTVNTSNIKTIAQGDGLNTTFTFSFIGVSADNIEVILTDSAGVETTLNPSVYSITLNAALPGALWGIGGEVEYPLVGTPIPSGSTLTMARILTLTQAVTLQNQASFGQLAQSTEQAIDLLEMQLQQVYELFGRAISVPIVDAVAPNALPPSAQRASQALIFDSTGQPTAGQLPASGIISAAMAPVVSAATLAAGRTAFGLGAAALEGIGAGLQDDGAGLLRVNFPIVEIAINTAINSASAWKQYIATGPINLTFVRANTLWDGFTTLITAVGNTVTCLINAADSFTGQDAAIPLVIPAGASVMISTNAAAAGKWLTRWLPRVEPQFQCLLTVSGSTLALSRANGLNLFINGRNEIIPAAGLSYAPSASVSTTYYIYAFMSSGVMTLEPSLTAPAVSAVWGHKIKTGDASRSLVGQARTSGAGNWTESITQRFVRSYYNDPGYNLLNNFTADRTTPALVYGELNAEIRIEFLIWAGETIQTQSNGQNSHTVANGLCFTSISFDNSPVAQDSYAANQIANGPVNQAYAVAVNSSTLTEGYHFATLVGKTGAGTAAWVSVNSSIGARCTLRGFLRR